MKRTCTRSYDPGRYSHSASKSSTSKVKLGGTLRFDEHINSGLLSTSAYQFGCIGDMSKLLGPINSWSNGTDLCR